MSNGINVQNAGFFSAAAYTSFGEPVDLAKKLKGPGSIFPIFLADPTPFPAEYAFMLT
jgi:hypothetical protein